MHCTTSFFNTRREANNRRMDFLAALAASPSLDDQLRSVFFSRR